MIVIGNFRMIDPGFAEFIVSLCLFSTWFLPFAGGYILGTIFTLQIRERVWEAPVEICIALCICTQLWC